MPQFVMIGWDGPEGAKRREEQRRDHLAYVTSLNREGRIVLAGPIRNEANDGSIGVVIVLEAASLEEARTLVDGDPYVVGGVFESIAVKPFKQVFPEKP